MFGRKKQQIKILEGKVAELEVENRKLVEKFNILLNHNRQLTASRTAIIRENSELKDKVAELESKLAIQKLANRSLQNSNKKLNTNNKTLTQKIEHKNELHRNRQRKYMAAKKEKKAAE